MILMSGAGQVPVPMTPRLLSGVERVGGLWLPVTLLGSLRTFARAACRQDS